MKKIVLILSAVLAFGCSGSDDSDNVNPTVVNINPPAWIQGTWLLEGNSVQSGFRFTSDDVCINSLGMYACNKESLEMYQGTQVNTNVNEEISDTEYSVEITVGSNTTTFEFKKVSATQIKWVNSPAQANYTKQ